ncbi:hypothetical protein B566_EDAN011264, partial [Ephemera danica]
MNPNFQSLVRGAGPWHLENPTARQIQALSTIYMPYVTVHVQNENFKCQSCVLSFASPVLANMLRENEPQAHHPNQMELRQLRIQLNSMLPIHFRIILEYKQLTPEPESINYRTAYHSDCYTINFIEGDIYDAPKEYCYVQCVSKDLHCGAGIAAQFKAKYGGIEYIKAQNKKMLPIEEERYLINLITKAKYFEKPTMNSIERCLWQLKYFCTEFVIRKIAMPLIACGLDRQPWDHVQKILEKVMGHSIIDIKVYTAREKRTEWPP